MVIYVDVLFIINFFITFLLLRVTSVLSKRNFSVIRAVVASAFGGLYSLIILADNISPVLLTLSKPVAAVVFLLIAFKFYRVRQFVISLFVFLFANFVFLGIIAGIYFLSRSDMIVIHNSIVYFDISARSLLGCAFFAYIFSCVIVRLYNRALSKKEIYTITVEYNSKSVTLFAFADTGNNLTEPFSNAPVIIADREKISQLSRGAKTRIIPISTVNSQSLLTAFKPDRVTVKASGFSEVIDNVYIAMSDDIKEKSFSAIINPKIL